MSGAEVKEGQPQEIKMTIDLNDLDAKMDEMMLSLQPGQRESPEIAALKEQRIAPPFEKTAEVLEPYRGRYKGQRCFIVGNGPSLRAEDLERIKGEFCIGCNRVYKLFNETSWRPRVYTGVDENLFRDTFKEVSSLDAELKLCSLLATDMMYPVKDLLPLKLISKGDWIVYQRLPEFSDDITKCVYHATTISYINMQIAAFMGFDEVFLLGFDHQFPQQWRISPVVLKNPEKYVNAESIPGGCYKVRGCGQSEFYPSDYSGSAYCIEEVTRGYRKAKMYFEEHGRRIANVTRGGKLDVFERVNFDKLMDPKIYPVSPMNMKGKPEKKHSAKQSWMKKSGRR